MHIEVAPDGVMERVALVSGWAPTPLVLGYYALGAWKVLQCGQQVGLYDALAPGPLTVDEAARACGCDPTGMRVLLTGLAGYGIVRKCKGKYVFEKEAARFLASSSPTSVADLLAFGRDLERLLDALPDAVRTGRHLNLHHIPHDPGFWDRYLGGLASAARFLGPVLARLVPLPAPRNRLLDVAGGHGLWSAGYCGRYPGLRATVLDLPEALPTGRSIVEKAGFADRVTFLGGDLRTTPWGEGWDAVLLFNILHNLGADDAARAMEQAFAALRPGGVLVIVDGENPGDADRVTMNAAFGALLFFVLSDSGVWPEPQVRTWATGAGFSRIHRRRVLQFPGLMALTCVK